MLLELLIIVVAYCIGSIPSGLLIARARGVHDIRSHGSGNIGATNVARVLGYKFFLIVFFADCFKAYGFLTLVQSYGADVLFVCFVGAALVIGNGASLFLRFRGGKGIATIMGLLLALDPWIAAYVFIVWLVVFLIIRTVGIASVAALLALPLITYLLICHEAHFFTLSCFIALFGLYLHRDNIFRFYNEACNRSKAN